MSQASEIREKVLRALREQGELSLAALTERAGLETRAVSVEVCGMFKRGELLRRQESQLRPSGHGHGRKPRRQSVWVYRLPDEGA